MTTTTTNTCCSDCGADLGITMDIAATCADCGLARMEAMVPTCDCQFCGARIPRGVGGLCGDCYEGVQQQLLDDAENLAQWERERDEELAFQMMGVSREERLRMVARVAKLDAEREAREAREAAERELRDDLPF